MAKHLIPKFVKNEITTNDTVLDICCGIGEITRKIKAKNFTCVDIYRPYLEKYHHYKPDRTFINCDVTMVNKLFLDNSFDIVLAIDAVEHLDKNKAIKLIKDLEKIARKKLVIFTPEPIEKDICVNEAHEAWGISGGEKYQIHKCSFKRSYFQNRDYKCIELQKRRNRYDYSKYYEMLYIKNF
jgi:2-polyprenyl-3-methyl-5-hydroxy-6-metoxy-1,4-benzoquinol methylase